MATLGALLRKYNESEPNLEKIADDEFLAKLQDTITSSIDRIAHGRKSARIEPNRCGCIQIEGRDIMYPASKNDIFKRIRERLVEWLKTQDVNVKEYDDFLIFSW